MKITKDSVVSIHYTLRGDDNEILDSSTEKDPLVYLHGSGGIIPGLEKALEGQGVGARIKVSIPPEEAYGVRNEKMVQSILKSEFQDSEGLTVGAQFQVSTQRGPILLTVVEVKDNEVVVDGNHPLAGATLHFDVEVKDVRKPTKEELAHGHAHGHAGHSH